MPVLQKIKKQYPGPLEVGVKYYSILSVLNNLKLTERQVQLLAFTAVRGDIASGGAKQQFIEWTGTSLDTIGNLICFLHKKKLLVKEESKIKINPAIQLDFNQPLQLQLNLTHEPVQ